MTQACSAVTFLTLRRSSGMHGNGDGEYVPQTECNEPTEPLDCEKETGLWNNSSEALTWGQCPFFSASCSILVTRLVANKPTKKTLKFTTLNYNSVHIIKIHLASGTTRYHTSSFTVHLFKIQSRVLAPRFSPSETGKQRALCSSPAGQEGLV